MREIKFRAWDNQRNRIIHFENLSVSWFYEDDYRLEAFETEGTVIGRGGIVHDDFRDQKPDVVIMQYTGLKDKNGKEIYEGDIMFWEHDSIKTYTAVEFYDGMFVIDSAPLADHLDEIVIGNIYENPNLLKE